jgi:hypothetical protein
MVVTGGMMLGFLSACVEISRTERMGVYGSDLTPKSYKGTNPSEPVNSRYEGLSGPKK